MSVNSVNLEKPIATRKLIKVCLFCKGEGYLEIKKNKAVNFVECFCLDNDREYYDCE